MMKAILVPLDGSPLAAQALPYAVVMARAMQARLVLLRAVEAHGLTGQSLARAQVTALQEAETYLEGLAEPLRAQGLTVDVATPCGGAAELIEDEIALRMIDLVVMATHGRSGLGRWVYGSVAARVLHTVSVPVLLVRAWQHQPPPALAATPRIVVPLDGSPFAEVALPAARELAAALGGELLLVQAVTPPEAAVMADFAYISFDPEAALADATTYLSALVAAEVAAGQPAQFLAQVGLPAALIAEAARASQAALIVMATHGRGGFGRIILGSVADATLRQGTTPLLLVHPLGDEAATADAHIAATVAKDAPSPAALDRGGPRFW